MLFGESVWCLEGLHVMLSTYSVEKIEGFILESKSTRVMIPAGVAFLSAVWAAAPR